MGENPVASFPQPAQVKKALSSLDFLVVTDMFLTETARLSLGRPTGGKLCREGGNLYQL